MQKKIFLFIFLIVLFTESVFSQTVHKDDLKDFVGVILTTPLNEPKNWSKDQEFQPIVPLDSSFHKYFITSDAWSIEKKYPHSWDSTSTFSIAMYPKNSKFNFELDVYEKRSKLVMLHNGGYEGSTSFLTLWTVDKDSLIFKHLFQTRFSAGLGMVGLEKNYKIDINRNLIFGVKGGGGDAGWTSGYYSFLYMHNKKLTELIQKSYGSDIQSQREYIVLYELLDSRTLLTNTFEFTFTVHKDTTERGSTWTYYNRKLVSSEHELINLKEIIEEKITTQ
jgi:hypothetical protein